MKICTMCKMAKDTCELHKKSTYGATVCKKCHRSQYMRDYYRKNSDRIKQQSKENGLTYRQTEEGVAARQRAQDKYRSSEQYRLKQNARKKVLRAVQSGKLVKPSCCEDCSQAVALEAHHKDYHKPLEVKWLCKECHENIHHLNEGHES